MGGGGFKGLTFCRSTIFTNLQVSFHDGAHFALYCCNYFPGSIFVPIPDLLKIAWAPLKKGLLYNSVTNFYIDARSRYSLWLEVLDLDYFHTCCSFCPGWYIWNSDPDSKSYPRKTVMIN